MEERVEKRNRCIEREKGKIQRKEKKEGHGRTGCEGEREVRKDERDKVK